jgi:hypothetical protein
MKTGMTIAILSALGSRADKKNQVGRYELLYAVSEAGTTKGTTENKGIWKIDTVTGQVWRFVSVEIDGKPLEHFVPIMSEP